MKKLVLLVTIGILSFNILNAQTSEHLTFQGIPIEGNLSEFVKKMESKGYAFVEDFDNGKLMTGKFANMHCEVAIVATQKTNQVCVVCIASPTYNSWHSVKSDYEKFKSLYTTKYGEPTTVTESFTAPDSHYEDDSQKLQALRDGDCTYNSTWEIEGGIIIVHITGGEYEGACLVFAYSDSINSNLLNVEYETSVLEDI